MFISKKYAHLFPSWPQEDQIPVGKKPQKLQESSPTFVNRRKMGLSIDTSVSNTHKLFILTNYLLLAAASSCIFLTLSLRLIPSLSGFSLILLHIITICGAISGCNAARGATKLYWADMVATVLTAILQGSVSVLIFTRPLDFLGNILKSNVRVDDGVVILKLAGGLSVLIFLMEWVVLTMAFFLKRDNNSQGMRTAGKVQDEEGLKY